MFEDAEYATSRRFTSVCRSIMSCCCCWTIASILAFMAVTTVMRLSYEFRLSGSVFASIPSFPVQNAFACAQSAVPSATVAIQSAASSRTSESEDISFILTTLCASYAAADRIDTAMTSCPSVRFEPPSRPVEYRLIAALPLGAYRFVAISTVEIMSAYSFQPHRFRMRLLLVSLIAVIRLVAVEYDSSRRSTSDCKRVMSVCA